MNMLALFIIKLVFTSTGGGKVMSPPTANGCALLSGMKLELLR